MKKLLSSLLLLLSINARAADQNFVHGVDFTAVSFPTQALYNQLVDNATLYTNKGLIILTNQAPNISANPVYTNYIWLNQSQDPPVMEAYSQAAAGWVVSSVGNGSITGAKIALNTIAGNNILVNTIQGTNIAPGAIGAAQITPQSITASLIGLGAIYSTNIAAGGVVASNLAAGIIVATNIAAGSIYGTNIAGNTITSTNLAAGTVFGTNVAGSTLTSTNFAAQALYGTNLVNNTITTNQLFVLANLTPTNLVSCVTYIYDSGTNSAAVTTNGTILTFAHGLTVTPITVDVTFVCNTTDAGYVQGDEINTLGVVHTTTGYQMIQVQRDATNIRIVQSNIAQTPEILNKSTGAAVAMTIANWSYHVRAVAYK